MDSISVWSYGSGFITGLLVGCSGVLLLQAAAVRAVNSKHQQEQYPCGKSRDETGSNTTRLLHEVQRGPSISPHHETSTESTGHQDEDELEIPVRLPYPYFEYFESTIARH